jgi:hypothetical protein
MKHGDVIARIVSAIPKSSRFVYKGRAYVSVPAVAVGELVFHVSVRRDGGMDLREIRPTVTRIDLADSRDCNFFILKSTWHSLELPFVAAKKDDLGNVYDLLFHGRWRVSLPRVFMDACGFMLTGPASPLSNGRAQSWIIQRLDPDVRRWIGQEWVHTQDETSVWQRNLKEWMAEVGIEVCVDHLEWKSADAQRMQAEQKRLIEMQRSLAAIEQRQRLEKEKFEADRRHRHELERIEGDIQLSNEQKAHELQILRKRQEREVLEADAALAVVRQRVERQAVEHEILLARLEANRLAQRRAGDEGQAGPTGCVVSEDHSASRRGAIDRRVYSPDGRKKLKGLVSTAIICLVTILIWTTIKWQRSDSRDPVTAQLSSDIDELTTIIRTEPLQRVEHPNVHSIPSVDVTGEQREADVGELHASPGIDTQSREEQQRLLQNAFVQRSRERLANGRVRVIVLPIEDRTLSTSNISESTVPLLAPGVGLLVKRKLEEILKSSQGIEVAADSDLVSADARLSELSASLSVESVLALGQTLDVDRLVVGMVDRVAADRRHTMHYGVNADYTELQATFHLRAIDATTGKPVALRTVEGTTTISTRMYVQASREAIAETIVRAAFDTPEAITELIDLQGPTTRSPFKMFRSNQTTNQPIVKKHETQHYKSAADARRGECNYALRMPRSTFRRVSRF